MNSLTISPEWEDAPGVATPELAATWSRLTIQIGEKYATWVAQDGISRRGVHVSAYPLAEWIVLNWSSLKWENRVSVEPRSTWTWESAAPHSWHQRHNLRAASAGMTWPDLTLVPEGDTTEIVWRSREPGPADRGIAYLSDGAVRVSTNDMLAGLNRFVEAVIERLEESRIQSTLLQREWAALAALDSEESEFAEAASRLGLNPFEVDDETASSIVDLTAHIGNEVLSEFMNSASPNALSNARTWLTNARVLAARKSSDAGARRPSPSRGVFALESSRSAHPWKAGYAAAHVLRRSLTPDSTEMLRVEGLVAATTGGAKSGGLEGYVHGLPNQTAVLVLPRGLPTTRRRFSAATALGLTTLAPSRSEFILDPTRTDLAQAARAFAAELIAPAEGIEEYLRALGSPTDSAFDAIAKRYGTSATVVRWQYENQLAAA